jgi:hypothetical protein
MDVTWGKTLIAGAIVLLLSGCTASPNPASTPPASTLVVTRVTGDPEADRIIAILKASCERGKTDGLIVTESKTNTKHYLFPRKSEYGFQEWWNEMTEVSGQFELGGPPNSDLVCTESMFASRVVPKGSKPNENGVTFKYELAKISDSTFDWSMHRESPDFTTSRYTIEGDTLVSIAYMSDTKFEYQIGFGPFSGKIQDEHKRALKAAHAEYLYLTPPMYGMSFAEAKAYCKKHGLKIVLGGKDDELFYPSGAPGGKSDPKRMFVNVLDGVIVGVWTL